MFIYPVIIFCALLHGIKVSSSPTSYAKKDDGLLWSAFRISKTLFERCLKEISFTQRNRIDYYYNLPSLMRGCLLRRSFLFLDRLRAIDHLQIYPGVDLVRYRNDSETGLRSQLDRSYHNHRQHLTNGTNWWNKIVDRLDLLLQTRVLKIQMKTTGDLPLEEGRRRRHYHHMFPLMIFGTLAVIMIAIPMGFQFLAVLGGKALLLAKLALILTSIQGLKKIATSNLNYGLYHSAGVNPCKVYDNLDCPEFADNYEFRLENDQLQLSLLFEDLIPIGGHYDRSWYYNSKDDQQGYPEGDVRDPGLDLPHLFAPRNGKIK